MAEEITYVVRYKNNGDVRLERPTLIFEYPLGAVPSEGDSTRVTQNLEDIYPGQERNLSFTARLFGREGEVKEARAQIQYTPRNLNAQFESETATTTVISQVPLAFELDLPSRMESGQQFTFALNYFSNSSYPLSDLRIKMEYPEGFVFVGATPSPIGESEWNVGLLNRTEGGRISVTGTLQGSVQESKIFRATLGTFKEGQFTLLKEVNRGVEITRTRLLIDQEVNGSLEYVASPGDALHYVISFKNVSEKALENLFLIVSLDGIPFDLSSVKAGAGGTFQQGDNSVIFEASRVPRLRFLGIGEEGSVEFFVNVKQAWETVSPQDKNFSLRSKVILSDVTEEFEVKVASGLEVRQRGFFEDEVFGNQGPLPPRVGQETTYTVLWQVQNPYSDVTNVKVRAVLGPGVSLTGNIFPQGASLTFDQASREVVWDVGEVEAGTGPYITPPAVAFQISFVPLSVQRGTAPRLVLEARITADDLFAERSLAGTGAALDTTLPDDASVTQAMGIVQ
ncbi:MAG: hypothetical protein Q8P12_05895 [bacterium]|nr:hypothetical protein [bacterium]